MFVHDLRLLNNQQVQIIDTFLPQIIKKFVRINEKLELTNCKLLSVGFCQDLIVNAHGAENVVQISESSSYQVFKLTGVDCIVKTPDTKFKKSLATHQSIILDKDKITLTNQYICWCSMDELVQHVHK